MKHLTVLTHKFVEYIPDDLEDGTIYVSIAFATVVHKCCCGCGNEVVTPLSPTDWKLIFDGESISLDPSIGNWSFPCQSHYWIKRNRVKWAPVWYSEKIDAGRADNLLAKERYFSDARSQASGGLNADIERLEYGHSKKSIWQNLKERLFH